MRVLLLAVVPLMILVGAGLFYLLGGRFVGTENAYVKADMVAVTAQISGPVANVAVTENEPVTRGQLLFRIDPEPFRIKLAQAESALHNAATEIKTLQASYAEQRQQLKSAQTDAAFAEREYQRQVSLAGRKLVSASDLDDYRHKRDAAQEQLAAVRLALKRIEASLDGDPDLPVEKHPQYQEAKAARDEAALQLSHTRVLAPFDGIVAKVPDPGQYVSSGTPVMSLVAANGVWVEANLKETQLTGVRPGQRVTIDVDTYPDVQWHGHVESIAQATGAEFSVLPPQNATGNWVKVVQRVPVRIAIDSGPEALALRSGLSAVVSIDTGWHHRGPKFLEPVAAWTRSLVSPARAEDRP